MKTKHVQFALVLALLTIISYSIPGVRNAMTGSNINDAAAVTSSVTTQVQKVSAETAVAKKVLIAPQDVVAILYKNGFITEANLAPAKQLIASYENGQANTLLTFVEPSQGTKWIVGNTYPIKWTTVKNGNTRVFFFLSGGGREEGYKKYIGTANLGAQMIKYTPTKEDVVKPGYSWKIIACDTKTCERSSLSGYITINEFVPVPSAVFTPVSISTESVIDVNPELSLMIARFQIRIIANKDILLPSRSSTMPAFASSSVVVYKSGQVTIPLNANMTYICNSGCERDTNMNEVIREGDIAIVTLTYVFDGDGRGAYAVELKGPATWKLDDGTLEQALLGGVDWRTNYQIL